MTASTHYHIRLSDEERLHVEQWSFNFYHHTGRMMRIPPRLYEDLKNGGCRMKYMVADPDLEDHGNAEAILTAARQQKEH